MKITRNYKLQKNYQGDDDEVKKPKVSFKNSFYFEVRTIERYVAGFYWKLKYNI